MALSRACVNQRGQLYRDYSTDPSLLGRDGVEANYRLNHVFQVRCAPSFALGPGACTCEMHHRAVPRACCHRASLPCAHENATTQPASMRPRNAHSCVPCSPPEFHVTTACMCQRVSIDIAQPACTMRMQTHAFAKGQAAKWGSLAAMELGVWEAAELLNEVVDDSDPDIEQPQLEHLLQTAEAIRAAYPQACCAAPCCSCD